MDIAQVILKGDPKAIQAARKAIVLALGIVQGDANSLTNNKTSHLFL